MYILLRAECVDEVALQALLPSSSAWEVQAGDRRNYWRMVRSAFDVKLEEDGKSRQEIRSFGPGLKP